MRRRLRFLRRQHRAYFRFVRRGRWRCHGRKSFLDLRSHLKGLLLILAIIRRLGKSITLDLHLPVLLLTKGCDFLFHVGLGRLHADTAALRQFTSLERCEFSRVNFTDIQQRLRERELRLYPMECAFARRFTLVET